MPFQITESNPVAPEMKMNETMEIDYWRRERNY